MNADNRQAAIDGLRGVVADLCTCGEELGLGTPHLYLCPTRRIMKWVDRLLATLPPPSAECDNYGGGVTCLTAGCTTPCDRCRRPLPPGVGR